MATPYTGGKNGTNRSGGHTSTGVHQREHGAGGGGSATAKKVNRLGGLKTNTKSMGKP